jgi:hypothetical protein
MELRRVLSFERTWTPRGEVKVEEGEVVLNPRLDAQWSRTGH